MLVHWLDCGRRHMMYGQEQRARFAIHSKLSHDVWKEDVTRPSEE